jgi:hypothetical protein
MDPARVSSWTDEEEDEFEEKTNLKTPNDANLKEMNLKTPIQDSKPAKIKPENQRHPLRITVREATGGRQTQKGGCLSFPSSAFSVGRQNFWSPWSGSTESASLKNAAAGKNSKPLPVLAGPSDAKSHC